MSASMFLVVLAAAILILMLLILKLKVHPVMALFSVALVTGIVLGYGVSGTADMIGSGFGGTLGSVGITIILGAIISMAIEDTGAAKSIANFFIKLFRGKNMELAPSLTAFIMSIPVFGDITMVLTSPIASMYANPEGMVYKVCTLIGHKVIALFIGVLYSLWLGYKQRRAVLKAYEEHFPEEAKAGLGDIMLNKWVARGLVVCLSPLLITAMGGAFGTILKSAPALAPLSEAIGNSPIPAILIPWAIAAIMMTAVGSMTTAGMTAAGIVLPMLPALGLSPLAAVLAIGAGTLMVDHVNNSGFWVMGQFFNLDTKQSLKYVTFPSVVGSIICIIVIALLNMAGVLG